MPPSPPLVATAIAGSAKPDPALVYDVVAEALAASGGSVARSVLLFLSADFARQQALVSGALTAASRASRCLQIVGATVPGLFTEKDWLLDRSAAAAMVFAEGASLMPLARRPVDEPNESSTLPSPLLTLSQHAHHEAWQSDGGQRFGLLAADSTPPGRIWSHAQLTDKVELTVTGCRGVVSLSRGIRVLSPLLHIGEDDGYDVTRLDRFPALNTLIRELPLELRNLPRLPLHLLCAGLIQGDPNNALEEERYTLLPLIGWNQDDKSVTLAGRVTPNSYLFWALRSPMAAETELRHKLESLDRDLGCAPDFGIVMSCLGRGPYFYEGTDRDLDLIKARYPDTPLIGAYCARQISPLHQGSGATQNALVTALFARESA